MTAFDSRSLAFRRPFGAVETGSEVEMCIRPSRGLGVTRAFLCQICDETGRTSERQMDWEDLSCGTDVYSIRFRAPETPGLVWYYFRLEGAQGVWYLCRGKTSRGEYRREASASWQMTVYRAENIPRWYGEGVTYHIFPDRFCRSKKPDAGAFPRREIHENWEDMPVYQPNQNGEITNTDFFGGDLDGITSKLDYLQSLGVTTIYLSPIFESASNHRYDTGDYSRVDPMLGDEAAFSRLCDEAQRLGMRVMLDGVFNHTGFDSVYFNGRGTYDSVGAYQSQASQYYPWYSFSHWPDQYSSWWGIYTLPQTNEDDPGYTGYIISDEDSIIKKWLRLGASAWRLDVADELPDDFIFRLKSAARSVRGDAVVLGEVWEDASNKISYGVRRKYILGGGLDCVMNYPFRTALLAYLSGGDAAAFRDAMEELRENYPPQVFASLMNIVGTHDTPRALTLLGHGDAAGTTRDERAAYRLTPAEKKRGAALLRIAALIQFAFVGSPCVYYGDEAGVQGFEDPFNRGTYPWGHEDRALLSWYRMLGAARRRYAALREGELRFLRARGELLLFERSTPEQRIVAAANRSDVQRALRIPCAGAGLRDEMTGAFYPAAGGEAVLALGAYAAMLLVDEKGLPEDALPAR